MVTEPEILLVDDEASIRLTLPMMLQSYGFKVRSAATVAEALRLMAEHRFDVLISDMNIDRIGDGFTVVSAMRSTQPHAVRFILTGYPDIDSALRALREDVDDYLIKPTEIEELVARITSRVQSKTLRGNRLKTATRDHPTRGRIRYSEMATASQRRCRAWLSSVVRPRAHRSHARTVATHSRNPSRPGPRDHSWQSNGGRAARRNTIQAGICERMACT